MKAFLGPDFQLETPTAVRLYEEYAKNEPIFDYHCHLVPKDIYEDRQFKTLTEAWLVDGHYGDHYKWRLMRANGIDEFNITGLADDKQKFLKWAETLPYAIGNPLYLWTHMELRKYFGITDILRPETAEKIYEECNRKLKTLTARKMIEMNNVAVICTTDDPVDDLKYHILLKKDQSFKTKVLPAFRPDKALNIQNNEYQDWISRLSQISSTEIKTIDDLKKVLTSRIDFFHETGCRVSDHALDEISFEETTPEELNAIMAKRFRNEPLTTHEIAKYKGEILLFLGKEYAQRGWVQQYHLNAKRNISSRMQKLLGPDTGFDAINDSKVVKNLVRIMDRLDSMDKLPKTILYSLNPKDNETLAAICNCFNETGVTAKIQLGSAWWFNDQKDGIMAQMKALANTGLISRFVGMLTDSRSFLSYPRHDYFRRILCNLFGHLMEDGEYPDDIEFVGQLVKDICFQNACRYFNCEGLM